MLEVGLLFNLSVLGLIFLGLKQYILFPGAKLWSSFMPDPTALLRCLLAFTLNPRALVSQSAHRALIELGKINQRAVVTCMAAQVRFCRCVLLSFASL